MPTRDEIYLTKIAVEENILSQKQIDECLAIQAEHRIYRPLGIIFIEKGYLTDEGLNRLLLLQLQRTQRIQSPDLVKKNQSDKMFGEMIVEEGWATLEQLNQCLRLQIRKQRKGQSIPIGRFLVHKGILTEDQVQEILMRQNKVALYCRRCGASYNVSTTSQTKTLSCKKCGGDLSRQPSEKKKRHRPSSSEKEPRTEKNSEIESSEKNAGWDLKAALSGDTLGKYRISKELGRGAMGVVYEAIHMETGNRVALKVLPANMTLNAKAVQRFYREAHAAEKLSHPNIVPIFEIAEDKQTHYYVMEFIEGRSLDAFIEERNIDFREAADIIAQAADAVDYAHSQGVIHRDIKPENIILTQDKKIMITDFGLAKPVGSVTLTATGAVVGTPTYMSPEQARGREEDWRTDIYSLGATLYELTTFELPFEGEDYNDLLQKVIKEDVEPPRKIAPYIPRDLETITLKAMDKIPARRYQKASDMANDLRLFLNGHQIKSKPESFISRITRKIRRKVYWIIVSLLISCIITLSIILYIYISQRYIDNQYNTAIKKGKELITSNKLSEAIETFTKAIKIKESPDAYFNRSLIYNKLGKVREALVDLKKAVELGDTAFIIQMKGYLMELKQKGYKDPLIEEIEKDIAKRNLWE